MGGTAALALSGAGLVKSTLNAKQSDDSAQRDYQARVSEIQRQQQADAKTRQDALAKSTAAQRARFAAQGINPTDGSSGAVLDGMKKKTDQELLERAAGYASQRESASNSFTDAQAEGLQKKKTSPDLLVGDRDTVRQLMTWR